MDKALILLFVLTTLPLATASAQVGELDPAFDGDGIRTEDFDDVDRVHYVALQEDGKILVFGQSNHGGGTVEPRVTRYHADGSLDAAWAYGSPGASCSLTYLHREFKTGAVEPDGSILAAGFHLWGCGFQDSDFEVIRIDPVTGAVSKNGERPLFQGQADIANDLVRQPDGKIVAVGHSYGDSGSTASTLDGAIARYNTDLTLDTSFGTGGEVLIDVFGDRDLLSDVALQEDGKIVAVGDTTDGNDMDFLLVRLDTDGSLDTTFGGDGIVTTDFAGFDDFARGVVIQPDGQIVVVGDSRDVSDVVGFTVVRYDSDDGSIDSSFSTDGMVVVDFESLPANAREVAIQGDDKLVVAGFTETGSGGEESRDFAVARLDPSGALDPSFAGDGRQTVDVVTGQQDFAAGLVLQPSDGYPVIVGGTREIVDGGIQDDIALVRLVGDSCGLPAILAVDPQDIGTTERFEACDEVHAGTGGFRVLDGADVTFRSGTRIVLEDGFEVQSGGSFRAVIE